VTRCRHGVGRLDSGWRRPTNPACSQHNCPLNVWRPAATKPGGELPVLVWIHGGGYLMSPTSVRVTSLLLAIVACHPGIGRAQGKAAAWLDEPKPGSWNNPGLSIPAAPKPQGAVDPRCKEAARPAQLDEDKRVQGQGWDLVGAYQGGWQTLVIRGTAAYDGMCRPRQYQDFVFVRGVFAGTLSPQAMESRTDGALARVSLQSGSRLIAEYERYAASDPLCCPSRTTTVVFDIASDGPVLRPVSAATAKR
jgi:hypothetical protein